MDPLSDPATDMRPLLAALGFTPDDLPSEHAAVVTSVTAALDGAVASLVRSASALRMLGEVLATYGATAEHLAAALDAEQRAAERKGLG